MIPGPKQLGLTLILLAVPILEMALLFKCGQAIGFWPTLLIVIASAGSGFFVLWSQGFQVMNRVFDAMGRGVVPVGPVVDGFFILIAGMLLIMPGLITSAIGLALLAPAIRHRLAVTAVRGLMRNSPFQTEFQSWRTERRRDGWQQARNSRSGTTQRHEDGPIIEGEYQRIDDPAPSNRRPQPPNGPTQ